MNMADHMQETIASWDAEHLAGHLEGIATTLKTSNQPVPPTKTTVYALERAAKLLRGEK